MVIAQGPKRNIVVVWGQKLKIIDLSDPKTPIVVAHSPKHVNVLHMAQNLLLFFILSA